MVVKETIEHISLHKWKKTKYGYKTKNIRIYHSHGYQPYFIVVKVDDGIYREEDVIINNLYNKLNEKCMS